MFLTTVYDKIIEVEPSTIVSVKEKALSGTEIKYRNYPFKDNKDYFSECTYYIKETVKEIQEKIERERSRNVFIGISEYGEE
jgi:hypothetical protein